MLMMLELFLNVENEIEINNSIVGDDLCKVQRLIDVRTLNNEVAWLLCDYLNDRPKAVSADLIAEVGGNGLDEQTVVAALIAGFCGLDVDERPQDALMFDYYIREAVRKLDVEDYLNDPYYKNIKIPCVKAGSWVLEHDSYAAYEAFICDDLLLCGDFRELPQLGFFDKPFSFPVVKENGREWMAIKPSEIGSMKSQVEMVSGRVVALGLGLGYFAYMASLKPDVELVTIVEKDESVIELFEKYILPQFVFVQKIRIVKSDAFVFLQNGLLDGAFDYVFVDLWHDASDGLPLYLKTKEFEVKFAKTKFLYWVENSLLSAWRWGVFENVLKKATSYEDVARMLKFDVALAASVN